MHLSSRILLAVTALAICVGFLRGQAVQPGAGKLQAKPSMASAPNQIGGKSLKEWIKEISSADPSRRENAIRTVVLFGPYAAKEALPALLERIERDADTSPRVNAVMALGPIEFTEEEEVAKIVAVLKKRITGLESQSFVRFQAALILGRFGVRSRPAIPELIQATQDRGSWEIRKAAVFSLARATFDEKSPVNSAAVDAIIGRMSPANESSSQVRLEAAMSLGVIGVLAPQDKVKVMDAFKRADRDTEKMVTMWARVGLMAHNNDVTKADMTSLLGFLKSKELPLRTHAARALGTIAASANPAPPKELQAAVTPLIDMLRDDKEELAQISAVWALGRMGTMAQPALKPLNEKLLQKDITDEGKALIKEAIDSIQGKRK